MAGSVKHGPSLWGLSPNLRKALSIVDAWHYNTDLDLGGYAPPAKCECGAEALYGVHTGHSHWCPKAEAK